MLFPYRRLRAPGPVISLAGRADRPKPLVHVTLVGSTGSFADLGVLDTGSDDTVFHEAVAAKVAST